MSKTIIRFTTINRRTGETRPCYVSGARFKAGDGVQVRSVRTTPNRDEAASFSTNTAFNIALQFCNTPAALELRDGAVLEAETSRLLGEQAARRASYAEARRLFSADMRAFIASLPASLQAQLAQVLR